MRKLMVAELMRYFSATLFRALVISHASSRVVICVALLQRIVYRLAFLSLLMGASWPAEGQWTLDDKTQQPLGQTPDHWVRLENDKIHDTRGPALHELQQPGEGLSQLPAHESGNRVRWAKALDRGAISPRRSLVPTENKVQVLDMDVLLDLKGSFPAVLFPHKIHTQWLSCDNCHEQLFKSQVGATKIGMYNILQGEKCGLCHGSVAFPVTQCHFCHSVERPARDVWRLERLK